MSKACFVFFLNSLHCLESYFRSVCSIPSHKHCVQINCLFFGGFCLDFETMIPCVLFFFFGMFFLSMLKIDTVSGLWSW